jgi:hypothetical protein
MHWPRWIKFRKSSLSVRPQHSCLTHRNLRTRTSVFALVQQKNLRGKTPYKSWLISTLDNILYFKGTIFSGVYKTSLHFAKTGWR